MTIAPHAVGPGLSTSVLGTLSVAGDATPGATFDLTNNAAIITTRVASPAAMARQQLLAGRGGPGLGAAGTGQGITSSTATTANAADAESRSLGITPSGFALAVFQSRSGALVPEQVLMKQAAAWGPRTRTGLRFTAWGAPRFAVTFASEGESE